MFLIFLNINILIISRKLIECIYFNDLILMQFPFPFFSIVFSAAAVCDQQTHHAHALLCPIHSPRYFLSVACLLWGFPYRVRPTVTIEFFMKELSLGDRAKCVEFLQEQGVVLSPDKSKVDCKANMGIITSL